MKLLVFLLLLYSAAVQAQPQHEWEWAARARLAHVDETDSHGKAGSVLLRSTAQSKWSEHFGTLVQVDAVASLWQDDHSDGARLNGQPQIFDVPGVDLNQLLLSYRGRAWRMQVGRQRIELDDQRFVGGNGFWQNEQSFDALYFERRLFSASRLHYAYVANANRIFGEDADGPEHPALLLGDHKHHSHLVHFELNEWDATRLELYAYWIDNLDLPASSNRTFGGKFRQKSILGPVKYEVVVALAGQTRPELAGDPVPWYGLLESSVVHGPWRGVVRYEVIGEDQQVAFVTPLTSAHDFHGWADIFSLPPASGLQDGSVRLQWRASPWEVELRRHGFWTADRGQYLGNELDLELSLKLKRHQLLTLRYADFHPQAPGYIATRRVFLNYSWNL